MKKILFLLSLISLIISKSRYEIENDVLVLTEKSFSYAIREYKNLLILFFDPECPHCQEFMPEYAKIASKLKSDNFVFAKLDCIKYEKIANNYDIEYYPTLMILKGNQRIKFEGNRNFEEIKKWLEENTKPKITKINSKEELDKFVKDKICIVYFGKNEKTINEIILAERKSDDMEIGLVDNDDLIKQESSKDPEFIILYKNFEDEKNMLKENLVSENILKFINIYSYPKVNDLNSRTTPLIFNRRQPGLVIFSSKSHDKKQEYENYKALLERLWPNINDKIRLFVCDTSQIIGRKFAEYCGIIDYNVPKAFIVHVESDSPSKYMMNEEINEKNIINFIDNWSKGNLESFIRSEDIPDNQKENVFKLVGKTFKKEVLDNDKDVLIFFVSPTCQICKNFEPKLAELSKKLQKNNKSLLIAKMDATLNDIGDVQIHSFPTVAFYPGNEKDKDPIILRGKKSTTNIDTIENLIKKHAYTLIKEEENTSDL